MSSQYIAVDIDRCRNNGHSFLMIGSDKTPMKRNLLCLTCTLETGKTAIAAYGVDTASWGQWRRMAKDDGLPAKTEG